MIIQQQIKAIHEIDQGMKVSILIPYIRPDKVERCQILARRNAGIPSEQFEIIAIEDTERIGCPKMLKRLVEMSSGDLVAFLGDDTFPAENWLKFALEDMKKLPDGWGLVGLNDGTGRTLPTHWLADKRILQYLDGEFFHTGYNHCCCDVELMERCLEMKRFVYSEKSFVYHDHPLLTGAEWDADYQRVYSHPIKTADELLLKKRRGNGWKN